MGRPDPAQTRVHVLDADQVLSHTRSYPEIPWVYAGSRYHTYRQLQRKQGAEREVPFRDSLYAATYALKDDYIAFIGEMNCHRGDAAWHFSSVAERNCFISHAFATICILAAARDLFAGRSDPEILVICDNPYIATHLQEVLRVAQVPGKRRKPRWLTLLGLLPVALASRIAFVILGTSRRIIASIVVGKPRSTGPYAILSFIYDRSFRNGYDDVVFGPLIPWLTQQGYPPSVIPLIIPPTPYGAAIRKMRGAGMTFLVPEVFEPIGGRTRYAIISLLHPPHRLPPSFFHGIQVEEILEEDLLRDWAGRRSLESRILGDAMK
ncbi:MAG: hypothetical protein LUQ40_04560, partial [Methanomicrobiales archaeon]|nr:hypothetical protein [Methanomicrobiales archaeon]